MPWKESDPMSERLKFVGRYLDGESMSDLCKEFEISRKTGYKLLERYETEGVNAFGDQSRAAKSHPNQTSTAVEKLIVDLRLQHPSWGARKIKSYLEKKYSKVPVKSTIHAILQRNELVKLKKRVVKVAKSKGTQLRKPAKPNQLWCADFKGQFRLQNHTYCYPLTVTDQSSRFILACEAFENTSEDQSIAEFHHIFSTYGIPEAIRTDNGVPFASRSYFGVSKLSVFWLRLGISLERIKPGHPEENGCHERMHRTLKAETTKPAGKNLLHQQESFNAFKAIYNNERPHEALAMKTPQELYRSSKKKYCPEIEPLKYPGHDMVAKITQCGRVFIDNSKWKISVYIGIPFAGYNVGLKELEDGIWQINFMHYLLGYFDFDSQKIKIPLNPFLKERLY